jgi:hypothetical protein
MLGERQECNPLRSVRAGQWLEWVWAGLVLDLMEEYAQQIIAQTREELATVGVKKKPGRRPGSSWRRSKRSKI